MIIKATFLKRIIVTIFFNVDLFEQLSVHDNFSIALLFKDET